MTGNRGMTAVAAAGLGVATVAYYLSLRPRRAARAALPKTMKRLVIAVPDADLTNVVVAIEIVDIPTPAYGQVLVKVEAAPVVRMYGFCSLVRSLLCCCCVTFGGRLEREREKRKERLLCSESCCACVVCCACI
jgi:hypothetical protein